MSRRRNTRSSTAASSITANGGDESVQETRNEHHETDEDLMSPPEDSDRYQHYPFRTEPFAKTDDPSVRWFYNPRFLAIFFAGCTAVAIVAHYAPILRLPDRVYDHLGVVAAVAIYLTVLTLHLRDGPFRRPHPAVWRVVLALNLLYIMCMAYLYFHDLSFARQSLRFFDRDLGKLVVEGTHDADCSFTVSNVLNGIDIYGLAHLLGWFGKALILRDWWFLLILSVMFELCERTFKHNVPIFNECWWDSWGLDVLGANLLGAWLGMKLAKALGVSHLNWRGRRSSIRNPFDFKQFSWAPVSRLRNYISAVGLLAVLLAAELNVFFLKQLLWVPAEHPLVTVRLVLVFLWGLPATREYYECACVVGQADLADVSHSRQIKRMGSHAALMLTTVALELLCIIKWAKEPGEFENEMPWNVRAGWTIVGIALVVYPAVKFNKERRRRRERRANGAASGTSTPTRRRA